MNKVSFVVIGFNIENYIDKSINSISNQTDENIEIIFVNDGSTDNTLEKVNSLKNRDARIKIIDQKNAGANSARKAGLLVSSSEYVVFIDGDDWIDNKLVEELYPIAKEKDYDIIYYNHLEAYDNNEIIVPQIHFNDIKGDSYLKFNLEQKIIHTLWNKLFKRTFLIENKFLEVPNITMGDDLVANIFLGIGQPKVLMIDKPYYYYYQRTGAITKSLSKKSLEIEVCLESIEKILKENHLYDVYINEVDYLWFKLCYFNKVVMMGLNSINIKFELYKIWSKQAIEIQDNMRYRELLSNLNKRDKILLKSYNSNFYFGIVTSFIFGIMKKIKKLYKA